MSISAEQLAAIFDGAEDAFAVMATDGTVLAFNAAAERLYGYSKAETIGARRRAPSHEPEAVDFLSAVAQLERGERVPAKELRRVRKDGREIWVNLSFSPLRDPSGRLTAVFVAGRDVTERRRMLEDLKRGEATQALLASIVESSHDAMFSHDADGILTTWNAAAERLYGYSAAEIIGEPWTKLLPPEGRAAALARSPGVTWERPLVDFENVSLHKDGQRFAVSVTVSPLRDGSGQSLGSSVVARDLTARREAEALSRALAERDEQLRAAQKLEAIGALAGGVAHDFNNLLTVILTCAAVGRRRLVTADPLHAVLREIEGAGERAATLTRQLLAFARRQVLQPSVLDLRDVVAELTPMLLRLVGESVEIVTRADGAPLVLADRGQLEQVLVNLVANARDAMPSGGRITVEVGSRDVDAALAARRVGLRLGEHARIAVTDTGHGMDEVTRARLFEPFFTTKGDRGTGLGLATVFGIVKQSGGAIFVDTSPGAGATFEIFLPRTDLPAEATPARKEPVARTGHEAVLVVDDEPQVRAVVRDVLAAAGYDVLEATGAGDALVLAEEARAIDLLLTDVVMPRLSGAQLAARLVAQRPGLRVLFMSGYAAGALSEHGVGAGDLLEKPFRADALLGRVRAALDGRST